MSGNGRTISERKRAKLTGRGKSFTFLRLPHFLLRSVEFSALSGAAIKLLLAVAAEYNGRNNGDINIVFSRLSKLGWKSHDTLNRAKDELLRTRFLECTRHGGKHRAALYAVTWEPIDECPGKQLEVRATHVAPHCWKNVNPAPESGADCSD